MKQTQKRTWAARLLLLVFLPILLFSFMHTHQYAVSVESGCYECTNHLPHGGHISLQAIHIHDCVLCQFVSLSFVAAMTLVLVVARQVDTVLLSTQTPQCLSAVYRPHSPRAPPVI